MTVRLFFSLLALLLIPSLAEARLTVPIKGLDRTGVSISVDINTPCDNNAVWKYSTGTATWGCASDSTGAPTSATYVTISSDSTLTAEKVITAGTAIDIDPQGGDGGTIDISFDSTEVGATTWGSGSGFTWTFDSGATDPTIAFGSNSMTFSNITCSSCIALATETSGNYVNDVDGTSNEVDVSHTPSEGSTATISLSSTIDLGGKTSFEVPNGADPTTDAFGELAADNDAWAASRGALEHFDGTASTFVVATLASDTPSNTQVPTWNTGGTITWETSSGTDTNANKEYWWPASAALPLEVSDSIPPPSKISGTNIDELSVNFDSAADECRTVTFSVPSDVQSGSTISIVAHWKSTATETGNVIWDFRHNGGVGDDASNDVALTTVSAAADAVGTQRGRLVRTSWTETLANLGWSASEQVDAEFCRDANNASDTMSQDALVTGFGVVIPRA